MQWRKRREVGTAEGWQAVAGFLFGRSHWPTTGQIHATLPAGGDDRTARVWDLEARTAVSSFEELDGGAVHVARFHPDGALRGGGCIRVAGRSAGGNRAALATAQQMRAGVETPPPPCAHALFTNANLCDDPLHPCRQLRCHRRL